MRKTILLLLAPLLLLSLEGCGSLSALGKFNQTFTSQKNPVLTSAVSAAVTVVISKADDPKWVAANIKQVAQAVYQDAASPMTTVSAIEADLNTEIAKIVTTPAEKAAFVALASQLELILNAYVSKNPGGPVTATTLISIQGVALAVEQATTFFGA